MPGAVVSVHAGRFSCLAGSHFWAQQASHLAPLSVDTDNLDSEHEMHQRLNEIGGLDPVVLCAPQGNRGGGWRARALFIDSASSAGSHLPWLSSYQQESVDVVSNANYFREQVQTAPVGLQVIDRTRNRVSNMFAHYRGVLDRAAGGGRSGEFFHSRSRVALYSSRFASTSESSSSGDSAGFSAFGNALADNRGTLGAFDLEDGSEDFEAIIDGLRFLAEESDSLQGFALMADIHGGFAGIADALLRHVADEYDRPVATVGMSAPPPLRLRSAATAARSHDSAYDAVSARGMELERWNDQLVINEAYSITSIASQSSVYVPLAARHWLEYDVDARKQPLHTFPESWVGRILAGRDRHALDEMSDASAHSAIAAAALSTIVAPWQRGQSLNAWSESLTQSEHMRIASALFNPLPRQTQRHWLDVDRISLEPDFASLSVSRRELLGGLPTQLDTIYDRAMQLPIAEVLSFVGLNSAEAVAPTSVQRGCDAASRTGLIPPHLSLFDAPGAIMRIPSLESVGEPCSTIGSLQVTRLLHHHLHERQQQFRALTRRRGHVQLPDVDDVAEITSELASIVDEYDGSRD